MLPILNSSRDYRVTNLDGNRWEVRVRRGCKLLLGGCGANLDITIKSKDSVVVDKTLAIHSLEVIVRKFEVKAQLQAKLLKVKSDEIRVDSVTQSSEANFECREYVQTVGSACGAENLEILANDAFVSGTLQATKFAHLYGNDWHFGSDSTEAVVMLKSVRSRGRLDVVQCYFINAKFQAKNLRMKAKQQLHVAKPSVCLLDKSSIQLPAVLLEGQLSLLNSKFNADFVTGEGNLGVEGGALSVAEHVIVNMLTAVATTLSGEVLKCHQEMSGQQVVLNFTQEVHVVSGGKCLSELDIDTAALLLGSPKTELKLQSSKLKFKDLVTLGKISFLSSTLEGLVKESAVLLMDKGCHFNDSTLICDGEVFQFSDANVDGDNALMVSKSWFVSKQLNLTKSRLVSQQAVLNGTSMVDKAVVNCAEVFVMPKSRVTASSAELVGHSAVIERNASLKLAKSQSKFKKFTTQSSGQVFSQSGRLEHDTFEHKGILHVSRQKDAPPTALISKQLVTHSRSKITGDELIGEVEAWVHKGDVDVARIAVKGKRMLHRGKIHASEDVSLAFDQGIASWLSVTKSKNIVIHANIISAFSRLSAEKQCQMASFINLQLLTLTQAGVLDRNSLLSFDMGLTLPHFSIDNLMSVSNLLSVLRIGLLATFPRISPFLRMAMLVPGVVMSAYSFGKLLKQKGWQGVKQMRAHEVMPMVAKVKSIGVMGLTGYFAADSIASSLSTSSFADLFEFSPSSPEDLMWFVPGFFGGNVTDGAVVGVNAGAMLSSNKMSSSVVSVNLGASATAGFDVRYSPLQHQNFGAEFASNRVIYGGVKNDGYLAAYNQVTVVGGDVKNSGSLQARLLSADVKCFDQSGKLVVDRAMIQASDSVNFSDLSKTDVVDENIRTSNIIDAGEKNIGGQAIYDADSYHHTGHLQGGNVYVQSNHAELDGRANVDSYMLDTNDTQQALDFVEGHQGYDSYLVTESVAVNTEGDVVIDEVRRSCDVVVSTGGDLELEAEINDSGIEVYLESRGGEIEVDHDLHANNITIRSHDTFTNDGHAIEAEETLVIKSEHDVENVGGVLRGGRYVRLDAAGDVENIGREVFVADDLPVRVTNMLVDPEGVPDVVLENPGAVGLLHIEEGQFEVEPIGHTEYRSGEIVAGDVDALNESQPDNEGQDVVVEIDPDAVGQIDVVAGGKIYTDASNWHCVGDINFQAENSIEFEAKVDETVTVKTQHHCWFNYSSHTKKIIHAEVTGSSVIADGGAINVVSHNGRVYSEATSFLSSAGTHMQADREVLLYSVKTKDVIIDDDDSFWGVFDHHYQESLQNSTVTLVYDQGNTVIESGQQVDLSGAMILGEDGDLSIHAGADVIFSRDILDHQIIDEDVSLSLSLAGFELFSMSGNGPSNKKGLFSLKNLLSHDPLLNAANNVGHAQDDLSRLTASSSLILQALNAYGSFVGGVANDQLTEEVLSRYQLGGEDGFDPQFSTKVTHTLTTSGYQTLGDGGVSRHDVDIVAGANVELNNGVELKASGSMSIDAESVHVHAAMLKSSQSQTQESASLDFSVSKGVTGASVAYDEANVTDVTPVLARIDVAEGLEINASELAINGGHVEADTVKVSVEQASITTVQHESSDSSLHVSVSTSGQVGLGGGHHQSGIADEVSGIYARNEGQLNVEHLTLQGSEVVGVEVNSADSVETHVVHDSRHGFGFNLDFNINDFHRWGADDTATGAAGEQLFQFAKVGLTDDNFSAIQYASLNGPAKHEVLRDESFSLQLDIPIANATYIDSMIKNHRAVVQKWFSKPKVEPKKLVEVPIYDVETFDGLSICVGDAGFDSEVFIGGVEEVVEKKEEESWIQELVDGINQTGDFIMYNLAEGAERAFMNVGNMVVDVGEATWYYAKEAYKYGPTSALIELNYNVTNDVITIAENIGPMLKYEWNHFVDASLDEKVGMLLRGGSEFMTPLVFGKVAALGTRAASDVYKFGMVKPQVFTVDPLEADPRFDGLFNRANLPKDVYVTPEQVAKTVNPTTYMYVVDANTGDIVIVSNYVTRPIISHADLANEVCSAGNLYVADGRIVARAPDSGHFKPSGAHLDKLTERALRRAGFYDVGDFLDYHGAKSVFEEIFVRNEKFSSLLLSQEQRAELQVMGVNPDRISEGFAQRGYDDFGDKFFVQYDGYQLTYLVDSTMLDAGGPIEDFEAKATRLGENLGAHRVAFGRFDVDSPFKSDVQSYYQKAGYDFRSFYNSDFGFDDIWEGDIDSIYVKSISLQPTPTQYPKSILDHAADFARDEVRVQRYINTLFFAADTKAGVDTVLEFSAPNYSG